MTTLPQPRRFARSLPLQRTVLALVSLLTLGIAFGVRTFSPSPQSKRLTALEQQAQRICTNLYSGYAHIGQPVYYEEQIALSGHRAIRRSLAGIGCEVDGRHFILLFNQNTRRLCSIYSASSKGIRQRTTVAPITTPMQAIDVAVQRLSDLEMVPPGARFALAERPHTIYQGDAWKVVWNVKRTKEARRPYRLKMVLDRIDGAPRDVADFYEWQQPEQQPLASASARQ